MYVSSFLLFCWTNWWLLACLSIDLSLLYFLVCCLFCQGWICLICQFRSLLGFQVLLLDCSSSLVCGLLEKINIDRLQGFCLLMFLFTFLYVVMIESFRKRDYLCIPRYPITHSFEGYVESSNFSLQLLAKANFLAGLNRLKILFLWVTYRKSSYWHWNWRKCIFLLYFFG